MHQVRCSSLPFTNEWSQSKAITSHSIIIINLFSVPHSSALNIQDVLNTCQREKKKHLQQEMERDRKNARYLRRWNGRVGGCTCECRLLGAVSGKLVLSGKRRAALVRRSAPRPSERQSRFHGSSFVFRTCTNVGCWWIGGWECFYVCLPSSVYVCNCEGQDLVFFLLLFSE